MTANMRQIAPHKRISKVLLHTCFSPPSLRTAACAPSRDEACIPARSLDPHGEEPCLQRGGSNHEATPGSNNSQRRIEGFLIFPFETSDQFGGRHDLSDAADALARTPDLFPGF